jgi:translation elongation factor EF-Tu-like GTPase
LKTASGKTTEVTATTDVPLLRKRDAKKEEKLHNVDNLKPEEEEGGVTV